ncbi:MAG: phospho-sugar mutase [Lachnospiraceae bacterium]|nr:phospho-sugar mutase [Lachnospiraceae bacterium]
MDYLEKYREWCGNPYFDDATREELKALEGNQAEIEDRFYRDLEFGTGGLRGVIGAGTNRMNLYTVRKATQGLANFIIKEGGQDKGIAIAYDSRNMSVEFSEEVALCMCANGIKAYRFESLRPTPMLSYALRTLGCIAGVVITASHNPAEYNGYKVYWEDGAQITYPKDELIINEVNNVTDFNNVKTMSRKEAEEKGLYHVIGKDIDDPYVETLKKLVIHPDIVKEMGKDLGIVYTPLHGTGNLPVRRVLAELGFEKVYVVPQQEKPDGNFPTVPYPNPEDPKAFALALKLAEEKGAELVLATDPDADRLGVYAKDSKTGEYHSFTGNMSGMLICEYILSQKKELGTIAKDGVLVKTIVSTNMADKVAEEYGIKLIEVLTGFKYIGEQIKLFEQSGHGTYEFGFEESYGCLIGTHARDKDAVVAVMMLCEAAAYYKKQGLTLWDQMLKIYDKYGFFKESLQTLTLKGIEGAGKIKEMMENIRNNPPKKLGDYTVMAFRDYKADTVKNLVTGEVTKTGLPTSNVLYFDLDNDGWVCVRPSGTEPKIKFYIGVKGESFEDAEAKNKGLTDALMELAK